MKHPVRKTKAPRWTALVVRAVAFVFLGAILLARPANVASADKDSAAPGASLSVDSSPSDFKLEIQALATLNKDKQIAPLNLSVQVRKRIAYLSGPVPSAELRRRAIAIVEAIPGIREANTKQLFLTRAPRGEQRLMLPLEDDKPTETRSASPGTLAAHNAPTSLPPTRGATLLAPEAVAPAPRAAEPARLTANPRSRPVPVSIDAALNRLRQSDRRFRAIRTEIEGATVRVLSGDTPGEHVMAFARAVTRLAGVERVVLKDTSSRPR